MTRSGLAVVVEPTIDTTSENVMCMWLFIPLVRWCFYRVSRTERIIDDIHQKCIAEALGTNR